MDEGGVDDGNMAGPHATGQARDGWSSKNFFEYPLNILREKKMGDRPGELVEYFSSCD
jgi:hypothetical protein